MSIQMLSRCGVALCLAVLVSGCSVIGGGGGGAPGHADDRVDACKWNRSKCLYEGRYEAGERSYAEAEAKRLNQAALNRLRRDSRRL